MSFVPVYFPKSNFKLPRILTVLFTTVDPASKVGNTKKVLTYLLN